MIKTKDISPKNERRSKTMEKHDAMGPDSKAKREV